MYVVGCHLRRRLRSELGAPEGCRAIPTGGKGPTYNRHFFILPERLMYIPVFGLNVR